MNEIAELLQKMRARPDDDGSGYYCFTLTADKCGEIELGSQSIWLGFADPDNRVEVREARLVNQKMADLLDRIGESYVFVETAAEMSIYLLLGGHGLIAPDIAKQCVPEWLEPSPCLPIGPEGFVHFSDPMATALKKAPTPKLRMQVLKRDKRKCRICGGNPDDDVHVRLEVHHIRPWGVRGVTVAENLITLCQTCHVGLQPHYDYSLYDYVLQDKRSSRKTEHSLAVQRYRNAIEALG